MTNMICRISPIGNHLHCRCTICASIDGVKRKSRIAERCEKVPGNVTYEQWKSRYVEKSSGIRNVVSGSVETLPYKKIRGIHTIDEDLKAVNPKYKPNSEWARNCQKCVPTYELRRRGYDVTAKPVYDNDFLAKGGNYAKVFKNPEIIRCTGDAIESIKNYMLKWGNGARAEICIVWKSRQNFSHIFCR